MAIPISNVTRRVVYEADGTGPYAFTFEILANTDIAVYKDDVLLTLTTDYTVTIASNGTGSITLVASPTGADQIAIVGNRTIQRTTDFVTGGDFFANTVNDELDQQTIFAQQNAEAIQRALIAPQTDPTTIDMTLPRASVRANKTLAFDSNGDPTTGEQIGDYRGNWASGTAYNKRDLIKDTSNDNVYICIVAHTSTGSQPISTNADSAKWDLIVDAASAAAAQAAAEAAQDAAETAEANAETAETNAETAATAAASSASAASSSASAASTSATNAASSASTASTAATNAGNSATAAASSASSASSSASAASTSASNASSSASAASTSASNASTSATNAASSASAASTSASNASTSATNAAGSATAAAGSATAAASSASAASASADAALAALDSFDDRYLGQKASDPSLDNDGNALVAGALYFNTTDDIMKVYEGSAWVAAYASLSGALIASNNLSDLASAATARTNLGLGTMATQAASSVSISGGSITGITDLAIADGGTGASTAANARTNLGLAIGTDVQAYDADLTTLGAGGSAARSFLGLAIGTDVQAYDADLADLATNGAGTGNSQYVKRDSSAKVPIGSTWKVYESAGVLYFEVSGTAKAKIDGSGNLTVTGNVTAYGTV